MLRRLPQATTGVAARAHSALAPHNTPIGRGTRLTILVELKHNRTRDSYLHWGWSQMSSIPRHSSNGGAAGDPTGRTLLYEALMSSYTFPFFAELRMKSME